MLDKVGSHLKSDIEERMDENEEDYPIINPIPAGEYVPEYPKYDGFVEGI